MFKSLKFRVAALAVATTFAANYVKVSSEKYNPSASVHDYVDDDPSIIEFRAQFYW